MRVMFHFDVLQRHIDAGKPEDGDNCPIALAIKEAGHTCSVGDDLVIDGKKYRWPKELYDFIGDFDLGHGGEPFSFDLDHEDLIDPDFLIEEDDASL